MLEHGTRIDDRIDELLAIRLERRLSPMEQDEYLGLARLHLDLARGVIDLTDMTSRSGLLSGAQQH
jgi:hypothetical protein